jgi:hydroxymethylbilane synthase
MSGEGLRIGTRGSRLALAQAHETRDRLVAATGLREDVIEIVVIKTSGDRILDRPLAEVGGKGLFTKEIEDALLGGEIDLAVHSSKDMPTVLPEGLEISAFLPREDVRDAFLSRRAASLADLPAGAVVGTASLRRQAMVRRARPDLEVVTFRGNVQTRLAKLAAGEVDATLLAMAGLKRLGLEAEAASTMAAADFLPAVGQGAICIESRIGDTATRAKLDLLHDAATAVALTAERAFLHELDGSCRTPIAGWGRIVEGLLVFDGEILSPDGARSHRISRTGPIEAAEAIGREAGRFLRAEGGPNFFRG